MRYKIKASVQEHMIDEAGEVWDRHRDVPAFEIDSSLISTNNTHLVDMVASIVNFRYTKGPEGLLNQLIINVVPEDRDGAKPSTISVGWSKIEKGKMTAQFV